MRYALGKKPARNAVDFRFRSYFKAADLPKPPDVGFGHYGLVYRWNMLANDSYGDCVFAGAAHETMMWAREGSGTADFDDDSVLSDYTALTGFRKWLPFSDRGTDMGVAAEYRRKTGIVDAAGNRHQVDAYVAMPVKSWDDLRLATWLFGAVGVGLELPSGAPEQFEAGKPWTLDGTNVEGGHYVPCVGFNSKGLALVVTWGRLQGMSRKFYEAHNDEALAYISLEALDAKGLSPEGFDHAKLTSDLAALS